MNVAKSLVKSDSSFLILIQSSYFKMAENYLFNNIHGNFFPIFDKIHDVLLLFNSYS